ncbi:hypothetical protein GCM10022221_58950 [Actinocorallia aurea]
MRPGNWGGWLLVGPTSLMANSFTCREPVSVIVCAWLGCGVLIACWSAVRQVAIRLRGSA